MKRLLCWILIFGVLGAALPPGAAAAEQEIPGKSALLMDIATGKVLFEKNAHEALAPASVTKVMTMLLIMEAIDSGALSWNDTVTARMPSSTASKNIITPQPKHSCTVSRSLVNRLMRSPTLLTW